MGKVRKFHGMVIVVPVKVHQGAVIHIIPIAQLSPMPAAPEDCVGLGVGTISKEVGNPLHFLCALYSYKSGLLIDCFTPKLGMHPVHYDWDAEYPILVAHLVVVVGGGLVGGEEVATISDLHKGPATARLHHILEDVYVSAQQ